MEPVSVVLLVLLVEALLVIMYYGYLYLAVYPTKKKKEHSDRTKKCGPLPDGGLVWNSNCTIECDDNYVHDESGETCSCDKSLGYISKGGGCMCDTSKYKQDVLGNCECLNGTGVPPDCKN